jgi:hypothetical protein
LAAAQAKGGSLLRLPPLGALREFAPGGGAEARRADAALAIQRAWRAYRLRCRRQEAMLVFQKPYFR